MKHTKGKWSARGLHIMIEGKVGSQGQAYLQNVKPYGDSKWQDEEALANAKLMAAAPELLEVLMDAKENWKGTKLIGGVYEKICNAIKKATL